MVSFKNIALALTAATGALSAPFDFLHERDDGNATLVSRQVTPNEEGYHNGYFFSWWSDGGGYVQYQMGEGSQYSVQWRDTGNFVGGKGWNPGTGRTINYGGYFDVSGNGYLTVYGWTRSPLVEYYIVEQHGTYNPCSNAEQRGSFTSDGSNYQVCVSTRVQQPSIDGTQTFQQYWSIRQNQRSEGSVNVQNHFDYWNSQGMSLGNHYYQIFATEGYQSSGSSEVYVETG